MVGAFLQNTVTLTGLPNNPFIHSFFGWIMTILIFILGSYSDQQLFNKTVTDMKYMREKENHDCVLQNYAMETQFCFDYKNRKN